MNRVSDLESFAVQLQERMVPSARHRHVVDKEFNRLALQLFTLQYEENRSYRKACVRQGISAGRPEHWTEIPAVPTAAFKELDLSCISTHERTAVFFSSGTTEQRPSRHFHSEKSLEVYERSLLVWFSSHLLADATQPRSDGNSPACSRIHNGDIKEGASGETRSTLRTLALTPSPAQAPHSSLVHMFDTVRRAFFPNFTYAGKIADDGGWLLDYSATVQFLKDTINSKNPVLLLGTAFSYVHLLDHLAERRMSLQLPAGSRVLETGGYKGRSRALSKSELHALMTDLLGVTLTHIVCEYGMSELNSQAYDRIVRAEPIPGGTPGSLCFRFPPWTRVQIVSPETGKEVAEGETGLIRVFDLANVYSVMAIQTEDLAIRRGTDFELLGRAALAEQRGCSIMAG
jgi:hypothetical protein